MAKQTEMWAQGLKREGTVRGGTRQTLKGNYNIIIAAER
jgi:hypothetical protein